MPKIFDNIEHKLSEGLRETLHLSQRADFCVGYFSLSGWKELSNAIDYLQGATINENGVKIHRYCRLLIGMHNDIDNVLLDEEEPINDDLEKMVQDFYSGLNRKILEGIPNNNHESTLRKLSEQMKNKKLVIKLHCAYPLHAKLYLLHSSDTRVPTAGFLGSSNLTSMGLKEQGELNIEVMERDSSAKLAIWFEQRWDDKKSIDITDKLIEIIDQSWAADKLMQPYYIYLKMIYHLSKEARGNNSFKIPNLLEDKLLDFQKDAVLISAIYLEKRGGVFIGDVVGLGKTITATAIAKLFQDSKGYRILILCPANLKNMWEEYNKEYKLKAKILTHGSAQNKLEGTTSYDLVIIDESHNLRNNEGKRYKEIKKYIKDNKSKVILLSATPYNKANDDLYSQIGLFLDDEQNIGIKPEQYIEKIGGLDQFRQKHPKINIHSIRAFRESKEDDDWRDLMDRYLIRRTRSYIKGSYAKQDEKGFFLKFQDGRKHYFPERIPQKIEYEFDLDQDQYAKLYSKTVIDIISNLKLPRYGLGNFLIENRSKASENEQKIIHNLSRAGSRLIGFCRTNLIKRLESSGYSFLLSLKRHRLRNEVFIYALRNHKELPIHSDIQSLDNYLDNDNHREDHDIDSSINDGYDEDFLKSSEQKAYEAIAKDNRDQVKWIRWDLFDDTLLENLESDNREIQKILEQAGEWVPSKDRQLEALHQLIIKKHENDKIIIFTQFSDTAKYLTEHLKNLPDLKNQVVCVTGSTDNIQKIVHQFSPRSNNKSSEKECRILISTDVLSEGQNLQDAHVVVNYDLPWAIIKLIQRVGRVDRIGQQSPHIYSYYFLPESGIENIIQLHRKLKQRLQSNGKIIGSDEQFFEENELMALKREDKKLFDETEDSDVDIVSYAYQIWQEAIQKNPELEKIIPKLPNVIYATQEDNNKDGVIVYSRIKEDLDRLILIDINGNAIVKSQLEILKLAESTAETTPSKRTETHHELVKKGINHIFEQEKLAGNNNKPQIVCSLGFKTNKTTKEKIRTPIQSLQSHDSKETNKTEFHDRNWWSTPIIKVINWVSQPFKQRIMENHVAENKNSPRLSQVEQEFYGKIQRLHQQLSEAIISKDSSCDKNLTAAEILKQILRYCHSEKESIKMAFAFSISSYQCSLNNETTLNNLIDFISSFIWTSNDNGTILYAKDSENNKFIINLDSFQIDYL